MKDRLSVARVIAEKTMHLKNSKLLAQEVAAYLLDTNSSADIDSLMRDVIAYRAERGLVEAVVISAYPLTSEVRRDVMAELKSEYPHAKSINITEEIDPTVVGGLRVESVHDQLDLTVRSRLNTLKRLTMARN